MEHYGNEQYGLEKRRWGGQGWKQTAHVVLLLLLLLLLF
jgi:hypothetical protein